jgi:hypothetical protein
VDTQQFLATHPVFSLTEAQNTLRPPGGSRGTVERLKHYLETGRLELVTREVYATVPPGVDPARHRPDSFLVAVTVRPDALFSHHSALELLGAGHSAWKQCTVWTESRRKRLGLDGGVVHFLEHPKPLRDRDATHLGVRQVEWRSRLLTATGPERTLIEGFRKPSLAGGVEELVESAAGFPVLDLELLERLLSVYGTRYLWAATGWFLETYRETFHVPEALLARCEQRRPASPQYLLRGSRGGTFSKRWNLVLPSTLTVREPDERVG